jgi:hypothetical protein
MDSVPCSLLPASAPIAIAYVPWELFPAFDPMATPYIP